jgi:hypothetical protein
MQFFEIARRFAAFLRVEHEVREASVQVAVKIRAT